jgi:2,5-diamino-6-(ribosylamino)-4(3H)-pyrimidinone 5'-phosphate reductase
MELHYKIAGKYNPDAHLIGSNTIKTGIELFGNSPPEEKKDFKKPHRDNKHPFWVIPDTNGILKGLLHEVRSFEFCRDVVILVSKQTPDDYIDYLKKRNYDIQVVGNKKIDLNKTLEVLNKKYNVKIILTDTGKILGNHLINQGFVREISLLIHPIIVGKNSYNIFSSINKNIILELSRYEILSNNYIWINYKVEG